MKKIYTLLLVLTLVFTGCATESSASQETVTIEHELGTVEVPLNPQTTAVIPYEVLDLFDYFNLPVTGVSSAGLPGYLTSYQTDEYTDLGGLKEINMETLSSMNPDVIFISGRQADFYEELNEIAPTVYMPVDASTYLESVETNLDIIGNIYNMTDETNEAYLNLVDSISSTNEEISPLQEEVLVLMLNGGELSAFGEVSRFGMIYNDFGYLEADPNIEDSTHGMSVSYEYVAELNPEKIIVLDRDSAVGTESTLNSFSDNELIKTIDASKNSQIYYLDPEAWYLSSGGIQSTQIMNQDMLGTIE